jgi:hypothetical protein
MSESSLSRADRSQSVMSSISLQDSQLQFYDAIEDFSSDSDSDEDSDQDSETEGNDTQSNIKVHVPAIVPGKNNHMFFFTQNFSLFLFGFVSLRCDASIVLKYSLILKCSIFFIKNKSSEYNRETSNDLSEGKLVEKVFKIDVD